MMLNPIFESSARRRMRTGKTPLILTAYTGVLLIFTICQMTMFFGRGMTVSGMRVSTECYIWVTALQFLLIVLVAPAISAGSIAGERERQTFDLLLVTGIGPRSIVLGKLLESYVFLVLLILAGMPVMALAHVTSGVPLGDLAMTLVYLAVIALAALSVGMVMSVLFKRSLTAIIASYLAIFLIGAGTWGLAKHGPIAAQYTYLSLGQLAYMSSGEVMRTMPATIFFNPAVGLVMLLASQTGILHTTMRYTMRLLDIYIAAGYAGYDSVAMVTLAGIFVAAVLLILLAIIILRMQTGAGKKR